MKVSHYISILAIAAIIGSCAKDGPTGPIGATGATGASGLNGAANLLTNIYMVTSSDWTSNATPAYHWTAGFIDTNITANNLDVVLVSWSTVLGSGWTTLPNTSLINPGDELSYRYNNDSVSFTYYTGGSAVVSSQFLYQPK